MAQDELQVRGKTAYLFSVMEKRSQRKKAFGPERWRIKDRMQENSRNFRGGKCEPGSD